MYDSLNMHSLESSLIDIMRAEQDPMKGKISFPFLSLFVGLGGGVMFVRCDSLPGRNRPIAPGAVLFFQTCLFSPC